MTPPLLAVRDMTVSYGAIRALRGISFDVSASEAVAIIGANGAGKSTLMRALSGLVPLTHGKVLFEERPLASVSAHCRAQRGILHVREGRGVFGRMNVQENLRLTWEALPKRRTYADALRAVFKRFPRLEERRAQLASNLSGGEQQMLALSRAIIAPPKLLLVDEPSLGLSPLLTKEVFSVLADLRQQGVTILLVEQNVRSALALADRAYVLNHGIFAMSGAAQTLLHDPIVTTTYLGGGKYSDHAAENDNETREEKTA